MPPNKKNCDKKKLKSKKNAKGAVEKMARKTNVKKKCTVAIGNRDVRKKKDRRKIYTPENLKNAIQDYTASKSLSIRTVARTYGIPPAILARKVKNPSLQDKRSGPSTVLNSNEEEDIVKWIFDRAAMGLPVTKDDLLIAVKNYVTTSNKDTPVIDNRPGRHWYESFKRRHPNLTIRTPQHLSHRRAEVTRDDLQEWFNEQKKYLSSKNLLNISSSRVFNCNETNVALCPKSNKILTKKGSLTAYKITDDGKEGITVLFMYSAAGIRAPPMVMFPYKENLPRNIITKIPKGWGIGISDNGWMTLETFYEYITNIFYPWLVQENIEFPVVIYLDNHSSHLTMPLVKFCREKEIELIGLYPNSTHIMQPLDIAFFHPFKEAWKKIVPKWKNENNMKQLKKEDVGIVLKKARESIPEENIIKNGFKACGLVPSNPNAIDYNILCKRKSKEPVSLENGENNDQHLLKFEDNLKQISPNLLQEFENDLPTGLWTGSLEKKALFEYWFRMKSSRTEFPVCTKDSGTGNVFHEEKVLRKGNIEESIPVENTNETLILVINAPNMTFQENVSIEFLDNEDLRSGLTSSNETLKENCSALANLEPAPVIIEEIEENCSILTNLEPAPVIEKTKENCSNLANLEPTPVIEKTKENCSILTNLEPTLETKTTTDNCNTFASEEKEITSVIFKNAFTLPTNYLPKKKRSKVETSGKAKLPAAGTSDAWFEFQLEKEKKQKLKEEKLAHKKELQEKKKKLAQEKKCYKTK